MLAGPLLLGSLEDLLEDLAFQFPPLPPYPHRVTGRAKQKQ